LHKRVFLTEGPSRVSFPFVLHSSLHHACQLSHL
jgi:hypothetical protein